MTLRPDSRLTRFRRKLAKRIAPGPPPGEAWCLHCSLNGGQTLIIPADSGIQHAGVHQDQPNAYAELQIGSHPVRRGGL